MRLKRLVADQALHIQVPKEVKGEKWCVRLGVRTIAGHRKLRVVPRGSAGKPTAVGAPITVELADKTPQTSEVYAGSGYESQSTPACHLGYLDSNPPKKIRVRWTSSATSEHNVPAKATTLNLSAPPM